MKILMELSFNFPRYVITLFLLNVYNLFIFMQVEDFKIKSLWWDQNLKNITILWLMKLFLSVNMNTVYLTVWTIGQNKFLIKSFYQWEFYCFKLIKLRISILNSKGWHATLIFEHSHKQLLSSLLVVHRDNLKIYEKLAAVSFLAVVPYCFGRIGLRVERTGLGTTFIS